MAADLAALKTSCPKTSFLATKSVSQLIYHNMTGRHDFQAQWLEHDISIDSGQQQEKSKKRKVWVVSTKSRNCIIS